MVVIYTKKTVNNELFVKFTEKKKIRIAFRHRLNSVGYVGSENGLKYLYDIFRRLIQVIKY